jgi:LPS-assembly lipoprotein
MRAPTILAASFLLGAPLLSACGFEPLYAEHRRAALEPQLTAIKVLPIQEHVGQLLQWKLETALNPANLPVKPRYALHIALNLKSNDLTINSEAVSTRGNIAAVADCTLTTLDNKTVLYRDQIQSAADYNIVNNAYSAQIGQGGAEKEIVDELEEEIETRLAAFLRQRTAGP